MMQWYVLHTKPQKESFVFEQLCLRKIEAYYPKLQVKPVNPRARKLQPYFPGYLFVHVDLDQVCTSNLRWIPGVHNLVTYGNEPSFVSDTLLQAIRRKVDEINFAGGVTLHNVKPGDLVEIHFGPFAGYRAIFDARLSGNERVRVLLKMLQGRQVAVELPGGQIERIQ